jgi:hypothetical protein
MARRYDFILMLNGYPSFTARGARRDGIGACELFEGVDLTVYLAYWPLQNLNASLGSNACIAFIEIHVARRIP